MNLDDLNRMSDEAKGLDRKRINCSSVREKAGVARNLKGSFVSLLMDQSSTLRRHPDASDNLLIHYIDEIIEPMREDILAQIEMRMAAEEKVLFMRAAAKRQVITAAIVSKSTETAGGES